MVFLKIEKTKRREYEYRNRKINMEEKLSKSKDVIRDWKQFVERDKSKDYEEYASVSVMVMNISISYLGTNQNIMQSIYETTREAIVKILSHDKDFC